MRRLTLFFLVASTSLSLAADSIDSKRDYTASEWWIVYITAALCIFTLGLMFYTAKLWRATVKLSQDAEKSAVQQRKDTMQALITADRTAQAAEHSAKIAGQALSASQRAFVFWKGFKCGPHLWNDKIKEYVIFAEAENVGVTPALDVRSFIRVQVVRGSAPQPPIFERDTDIGPSTVMGPKASIQTIFLTVSIDDLIESWQHRAEIYVWSHLQYRDIFDSTTVHHHEQCAKIDLIHDPNTVPPEGHPSYLQFIIFGQQNSAS